MPDMPGNFAQPQFLIAVDNAANYSVGRRNKFMRLLLQGASWMDILEALDIGTAALREHVTTDFLGDDLDAGAYWPSNRWGYLGDKSEIVRQGAIEAIRLASDLDANDLRVLAEGGAAAVADRFPEAKDADTAQVEKKIDSWWMCAGHHFEVVVADRDTHVNIFILTPSVPDLPDERKVRLVKPSHIWFIGHQDQLAAYRQYYRRVDRDAGDRPELDPAYHNPADPNLSRVLRIMNKWGE